MPIGTSVVLDTSGFVGPLGKADEAILKHERKTQSLIAQQNLINKVMRQTGVSAQAAGRTVKTYGDKAESTAGDIGKLARALDKAQKETRELTQAQKASAGAARGLSAAFSGFVNQLKGLALAYVSVQAAQRLFRLGLEGMIESIRASEEMRGFRLGMEAATGSIEDAATLMAFARGEGERLGLNFRKLADDATKFAAASADTELGLEGIKAVMAGVSDAARVLNKSTDDTSGLLRALGQVSGKGVLQMEELRQQIGERLPGSLQLIAKELGITTAKLFELTAASQVSAEQGLAALALGLTRVYGPKTLEASEFLTAEVGRLKNELFLTAVVVGDGLVPAANDLVRELSELLVIVNKLGPVIGFLGSEIVGAATSGIKEWRALGLLFVDVLLPIFNQMVVNAEVMVRALSIGLGRSETLEKLANDLRDVRNAGAQAALEIAKMLAPKPEQDNAEAQAAALAERTKVLEDLLQKFNTATGVDAVAAAKNMMDAHVEAYKSMQLELEKLIAKQQFANAGTGFRSRIAADTSGIRPLSGGALFDPRQSAANLKEIADKMQSLWGGVIDDLAITFAERFKDAAVNIRQILAETIEFALADGLEAGFSVLRSGGSLQEAAGDFFRGAFESAGSLLGGLFGGSVGQAIGGFAGGFVGDLIGGLFKSGVDQASARLEVVGGELVSFAQKVEGDLGGALQNTGDAITSTVNSIAASLGGTLGTGEFGFLIRPGEEIFRVFFRGMTREFAEEAQAVNFAITEILKSSLTGVSENVAAALAASTAETVEGLVADLQFAMAIDQRLQDDQTRFFEERRRGFAEEMAAAQNLNVSQQDVIEGHVRMAEALIAEDEARALSIAGVDTALATGLQELEAIRARGAAALELNAIFAAGAEQANQAAASEALVNQERLESTRRHGLMLEVFGDDADAMARLTDASTTMGEAAEITARTIESIDLRLLDMAAEALTARSIGSFARQLADLTGRADLAAVAARLEAEARLISIRLTFEQARVLGVLTVAQEEMFRSAVEQLNLIFDATGQLPTGGGQRQRRGSGGRRAQRESFRDLIADLEAGMGIIGGAAQQILEFQAETARLAAEMAKLKLDPAEIQNFRALRQAIEDLMAQEAFIDIGLRLGRILKDEALIAEFEKLRAELELQNLRLQIELLLAMGSITEEQFNRFMDLVAMAQGALDAAGGPGFEQRPDAGQRLPIPEGAPIDIPEPTDIEAIFRAMGLGMQAIRDRFESLRQAMQDLADAAAAGEISMRDAGAAMRQLADQELLNLGDKMLGFLEKYFGDVEGFEAFRRELEELRFRLELANLELQFQLMLELGLISEEMAARFRALFDWINNNMPDFGDPGAGSGPGMQRAAQRSARRATEQATEAIETQATPTFRMEFQRFLREIGMQRMIPERDLAAELEAAEAIFNRAAQALRGEPGSEELLGSALEASRSFLDTAIRIGDINAAVNAQAAIERLGASIGLGIGTAPGTGAGTIAPDDTAGAVRQWGAAAGGQRATLISIAADQRDTLRSVDTRLQNLEARRDDPLGRMTGTNG